MKPGKPAVIHPFLFSLYPILFILAHNAGQVYMQDAFIPAAWTLGITLGAFLILGLVLRDFLKAGILVSAFVLLFFSFGHVFELVMGKQIMGFTFGRYRFLIGLWLLIFAGIVIFTFRMRGAESWTKALNFLSFLLVALNVFLLVSHEIKTAKLDFASPSLNVQSREVENGQGSQNEKPDIYYIILDAYGRSDVLKSILGYDNSEFIHFLQSKGFKIAEQSHSNYSKTYLSLASSLNMEYLDQTVASLGEASTDQGPLAKMIRDNRIVHFLKKNGYKIISFSTGYTLTEKIDGTDIYYKTPGGLSEFDNIFLNTTPIPWLNGSTVTVQQYDKHRSRILTILKNLPEIAKNPEPTFTFAHILPPHQPFVFGPNGEKKNPKGSFSLLERGTPQEYKRDYLGQVIFITKKIEKALEGILKNSSTPPLILIQGDHGSIYSAMAQDGTRTTFEHNWNHPSEDTLKERMSILNAYYLPGGGEEKIYPGITPVNTFRVILDYYFGEDMPLLKDESFFSPDHDYHFVKVFDGNERVNTADKAA